jgi:hypothetical protein
MAKTDQQYTGWYWWSKKKYGGSKENETESGATKSNASLELLGASFLYKKIRNGQSDQDDLLDWREIWNGPERIEKICTMQIN